VITNDMSDYMNLLVRIVRIICIHLYKSYILTVSVIPSRQGAGNTGTYYQILN